MADRPLHQLHAVCRQHLDELRGPFGIWQHARGIAPDEAHGSCTDDVARALAVDLLHGRELGWEAVRADAWHSVAFLRDAQVDGTGAFRNFRAADGTWLDDGGSQDSQGRAVLALGTSIQDAPDAEAVALCGRLLRDALPVVRRLTALRAISSALLGCDAALDGGPGGGTAATLEALAATLRQAFATVDVDRDWPWPEPVLTYENALLPRALIVAGVRLGDEDLVRTGLRVLDWLIAVQTAPDGTFSPVGCTGWWRRGGTRSTFDQQPIEATATIMAARTALEVTRDARYRSAAEAAFGWFLGDNIVGIPVATPGTGGCHDGLAPRHVNGNQGAESTLMWLTAVEFMRAIRAVPAAPAPSRAHGRQPVLAGARS